MGRSIPYEATVWVDLADFDTETLLKELEERVEKVDFLMNGPEIIPLLKTVGCPREVWEPLDVWLHTKVTTEADLKKWLVASLDK